MGVGVFFMSQFFATNLITTMLVSGVGALIYFGIMYMFAGKEVITDIKLILRR